MREGSAPNFCPPTEEGITLVFEDESGDRTELEFLGLILHNDRSYGFFFPVTEDEPVGSSGEVVLLEVTELDEDKSFPPIIAATRVYSGESPTDFPTTRG